MATGRIYSANKVRYVIGCYNRTKIFLISADNQEEALRLGVPSKQYTWFKPQTIIKRWQRKDAVTLACESSERFISRLQPHVMEEHSEFRAGNNIMIQGLRRKHY